MKRLALIILALAGAVSLWACAHSKKPHHYRGYTDEQMIERSPTPRPSSTPGLFDTNYFDSASPTPRPKPAPR